MIDEYIDEQKIITTVLKNAVEKNKISHRGIALIKLKDTLIDLI